MDERSSPSAALIRQAEDAVRDIRDPVLKKIAFGKVLNALLARSLASRSVATKEKEHPDWADSGSRSEVAFQLLGRCLGRFARLVGG